MNPSAKELKTIIKEYYTLINSSRIDFNSVKKAISMVNKRRRPGIKLIAMGMGLIILPEPTGLSDIIGLPLLILGKTIERFYSYIGIKDVIEDVKNNLESISSISSEMMISPIR